MIETIKEVKFRANAARKVVATYFDYATRSDRSIHWLIHGVALVLFGRDTSDEVTEQEVWDCWTEDEPIAILSAGVTLGNHYGSDGGWQEQIIRPYRWSDFRFVCRSISS